MNTKIQRSPAEALADRIAATTAEANLQLSLLSAEGREFWEQTLRPQLGALEARLRETVSQATHSDEAAMQLTLAMMEIESRFEALEPYLRDGVALIEAVEAKIPERAKLEAHLAALEARDSVDRRAEQARQLLAKTQDQVQTFAQDVCDRIGAVFDRDAKD